MAHAPGKHCGDVNKVHWSLLEGIITRTATAGGIWNTTELPVQQVMGIEKLTIEQSRRGPLGVPVTLFALVLLAIAGLAGSILVGVIGLFCLFWGVRFLPKQKISHDAYRLLGPGLDPEEWILVGSGPDVAGFVAAVQTEISQEDESVQTL